MLGAQFAFVKFSVLIFYNFYFFDTEILLANINRIMYWYEHICNVLVGE